MKLTNVRKNSEPKGKWFIRNNELGEMLATVEKASEQQPTRGTAAATEVDFNRERADSKVWELFTAVISLGVDT